MSQFWRTMQWYRNEAKTNWVMFQALDFDAVDEMFSVWVKDEIIRRAVEGPSDADLALEARHNQFDGKEITHVIEAAAVPLFLETMREVLTLAKQNPVLEGGYLRFSRLRDAEPLALRGTFAAVPGKPGTHRRVPT